VVTFAFTVSTKSMSCTARRRLEMVSIFHVQDFAGIEAGEFDGLCGAVHASACGQDIDFVLTVKANVTTLCPCSKAIAKYGAHNQRGGDSGGRSSRWCGSRTWWG